MNKVSSSLIQKVDNVASDKELLEALEKVLDKAYQLRDDTNVLMRKFCPDAGDNFSVASNSEKLTIFSSQMYLVESFYEIIQVVMQLQLFTETFPRLSDVRCPFCLTIVLFQPLKT